MMHFTPSPRGGIGQPIPPSRYRYVGCPNDHRNPELAGDCDCADLAQERASMLADPDSCGWTTAEECRASAARCAYRGEVYLCHVHHADSRSLEVEPPYDHCRTCGECIDMDEDGQCEPCWMREHPRAVSR